MGRRAVELLRDPDGSRGDGEGGGRDGPEFSADRVVPMYEALYRETLGKMEPVSSSRPPSSDWWKASPSSSRFSSTGHLIVAGDWLGFTRRTRQDLRDLHPARRHLRGGLALPRRLLPPRGPQPGPEREASGWWSTWRSASCPRASSASWRTAGSRTISSPCPPWSAAHGGRRPRHPGHRAVAAPQPGYELDELDPKTAFCIGCAQVLALFPGVSRSGATILGGYCSASPATAATEFSFFLALPGWSPRLCLDLCEQPRRALDAPTSRSSPSGSWSLPQRLVVIAPSCASWPGTTSPSSPGTGSSPGWRCSPGGRPGADDRGRRLARCGRTPHWTSSTPAPSRGRPRAPGWWRRNSGRGGGSRGRTWHSPAADSGSAGSAGAPARPVGVEVLSLRAGLAVADVLDGLPSVPPVLLKWPNDLMVGERKVGGMLCEARWQGTTLAWVAVGLGLNVRNPIPAELADRAVSPGRVLRRDHGRGPHCAARQGSGSVDLDTPRRSPPRNWRSIPGGTGCRDSGSRPRGPARPRHRAGRQPRSSATIPAGATGSVSARCSSGDASLTDTLAITLDSPHAPRHRPRQYRDHGRPLPGRPDHRPLATHHESRSHPRRMGPARWGRSSSTPDTPRTRCAPRCLASVAPAVTQSVMAGIEAATACAAVAVDARSSAPAPPRRRRAPRWAPTGSSTPWRRSSSTRPTPWWWISAPPRPSTASPPTAASSAGSSCPGLRTSADQLTRRAAKLPATELAPAGARHRPAHRGVHPGRRALRRRRRGGRHASPDLRRVAEPDAPRRRRDRRPGGDRGAVHHAHHARRSRI